MRFLILSTALLLSCLTALNAGAFYDASVEEGYTISTNLVVHYGAEGGAENNESALLQQAVDDVSAAGGGFVIIPQGDYQFGAIEFKSDVHIRVEAGTKIHHYVSDPDRNSSIFRMGTGLIDPIRNVSIRGVPVEGTEGDRFSVYLKAANKARVFLNTGNVRNFLIENVNVYDEYTLHSAINLFAGGSDWDSGGYAVTGTVANISAYQGHYGYGTVQCQAADSVLFTNLYGLGGCTLRLETGALNMNNLQFGGVHNIVGKDIYCETGKAAVMLGAHNMQNGLVTIEGVYATNCAYAATLGAHEALDTKEITNPDVRPGTFADGTSIHNIVAAYGTNATLKSQELPLVPPELEHLITTISPDGGKSKYAPAIAAAQFAPGHDTYMTGVRAYGFEYTPPVQTSDTDVGDGFTDDLFIAANYSTNLDGYFWSVSPNLTAGGTNWLSGDGAVAVADTSRIGGNHHALNFWGFSLAENPDLAGEPDLESGPYLMVRSDFRYLHQAGGEISANLNEAAFGLLLSTDKAFDAGANCTMMLANRGDGVGLAGATDGLITHSSLGVDPLTGGWSDWLRMEWYIVEGASNYVGTVSLKDHADHLLFKSEPMELGIPNGTKVFAGYTTGTNSAGGTVASVSGFEQIQLDNFKFERERIDAAPEFLAETLHTIDAVAESAYAAYITAYAQDVNGDEMSFAKRSGPPWLAVEENGRISGTPGTDVLGENHFEVEVFGSAGTNVTELIVRVVEPGATYALLHPVADAHIEGGDTNANFGVRPELRVQLGNYEKYDRKAYMRFDLSALADPGVEKAVLRLSVAAHNGGTATHEFKRVLDDAWGEYDITWAEPPTVSSNVIASVECPDTNVWVEVDLTEAVRQELAGDQFLSFEISAPSKSGVTYNSRETEEGHQPELVIYSLPSLWDEFVHRHGLSGTATDDFDQDGQSDIVEFALNGNPTNATVLAQPLRVVTHTSGEGGLVTPQLIRPESCLVYQAAWRTNLLAGSWNTRFSLTNKNAAATYNYEEVEYQLDGSEHRQLFFRLKVITPSSAE